MTESLLQQARRWREIAGTCIVPIGEPNLAEFLDAVIEHLENGSAVQYVEYDQRKEQRTHTLAIMAATMYQLEWQRVRSRDEKVHPDDIAAFFESVRQSAVREAERLLAEVEKRNP